METPQGRITAKEYIDILNRKSLEAIRKKVSNQVYTINVNRYYSTAKKVRDGFRYHVHPPIIATPLSYTGMDDPVVKKVEQVSKDIYAQAKIFWNNRKMFYSDHAIGALIFYKTEEVSVLTTDEYGREKTIVNPDGWAPVTWSSLRDFRQKLENKMLVVCDIVLRYPSSLVKIDRVEVYISNRKQLTPYDELRA
jgi:hypothetical protein